VALGDDRSFRGTYRTSSAKRDDNRVWSLGSLRVDGI